MVTDTVIIGGGLMGSAAAWQIARTGRKVILLEQQSENYSYGSSLGMARVTRSLGPKNDIFSWIQQTTVQEVEELIDYLNQHDDKSHSFSDIYSDSPVTYLFTDDQQADIDALIIDQTDPIKHAKTAEEANSKFDMDVPENFQVIREFKKGSGTMNPSELIRKLHRAIKLSGSEVRYNTKVLDLKERSEDCLIRLEGEELSCQNCVVASGPYINELLKGVAVKPLRTYLTFFKPTVDLPEKIGQVFPVAEMNGVIFYGMIEKWDDGKPILKCGGHFLRTEYDTLDNVWQQELATEEINWCKDNMLRNLSYHKINLRPEQLEVYHTYSCVYSLTENEVPIVDRYKQESKIVVLAGLSGIGAKGSMTYGKIAANHICDRHEENLMYQQALVALSIDRR